MPRRKFARRFDPRFGVSQSTIDVEATYVAKEIENYLLLSTADLEAKLAERRQLLSRVHDELEVFMAGLSERQRLTLLLIMYRDCHHMGVLYRTYLRSEDQPEISEQVTVAVTTPATPPVPLPFKEFLFDEEE